MELFNYEGTEKEAREAYNTMVGEGVPEETAGILLAEKYGETLARKIVTELRGVGLMEYTICEATGKRCYSKKDANSAIHSAKNHSHKKRIPFRSYYCSVCGTYHLTHFQNMLHRSEKSVKYSYKKAKENYKNHIGEEEL